MNENPGSRNLIGNRSILGIVGVLIWMITAGTSQSEPEARGTPLPTDAAAISPKDNLGQFSELDQFSGVTDPIEENGPIVFGLKPPLILEEIDFLTQLKWIFALLIPDLAKGEVSVYAYSEKELEDFNWGMQDVIFYVEKKESDGGNQYLARKFSLPKWYNTQNQHGNNWAKWYNTQNQHENNEALYIGTITPVPEKNAEATLKANLFALPTIPSSDQP